MQRLGVGAREGIEAIYREHGERLWWAVLAFTGDRDVTDDAVAEAFAQALRRGDGIRDAAAWVWRSAFRIAAGELKRRRTLVPDVPERSYDMPERASSLLAALARLSSRQRAAVVMHHYADRPVSEIATALGMSPATVAVHLHRGRKRLREVLQEDDDA